MQAYFTAAQITKPAISVTMNEPKQGSLAGIDQDMEPGYEFEKYPKKKAQLRGADGKFESKSIRQDQDFEIERLDSYGSM